jgi:hypothetical protein
VVIAREETPCRSGRVKLDRVSSAVPVGFATPGREHDAVSTAFANYMENPVSWAEN